MLSFEKFASTRKHVLDLGAELGLAELGGIEGYVYEDGYIEKHGKDDFHLVLCNQDWIATSLSALERILYDAWYVPENSPVDRESAQ